MNIIILDLDGTLVKGVYGKLFFEIIPALFGKYSENIKYFILSEHLLRFRSKNARIRVSSFNWRDIISKIARKFNVEIEEYFDRKYLKYYVKRRVRIFLSTKLFLETLKETGWKVWLLTNGFKEFQEIVLEETGLKKFFDEVFYSDTIGDVKPYAFKILRDFVPANAKVLTLGDMLVQDVYGSHLASFNPLLLDENIGFRVPPYDLNTLMLLRRKLFNEARYLVDSSFEKFLPKAILGDLNDFFKYIEIIEEY